MIEILALRARTLRTSSGMRVIVTVAEGISRKTFVICDNDTHSSSFLSISYFLYEIASTTIDEK
jgi:hypothetical protein